MDLEDTLATQLKSISYPDEAKQRADPEAQKRQRTAALQDLAEGVARNASRQRLGVRQPHAALTLVHEPVDVPEAKNLRLVASAATNFEAR